MKVSTFAAAALAASSVALLAMPAAAQIKPTFYGNLGYSYVDAGSGVALGAVTARAGARLHQYFGVEAEGALGVDDDSVTVSGVKVKTELKHSIAAYGVGFLPINEQFELFARAGYGTTKIRASATGVSASDNEESWNYGVGGQYVFDGANGVRGEYTRHDFNHGNGSADVWSVAYVRKF